MHALFVFITAMAISIVVLPIMVRLAPYTGMMDQPGARKVHARPIPRVGGIGIVLGALAPLLAWAPMDNLLLAYVIGSLVLFGFGALDDSRELGHYVKFIGQFIAVGMVVFYGDLTITRVPFLDPQPLPPSIGVPFTVFAMVGMINAINHSDGLDGLAGGESLLSLLGIAFLAYQAEAGANQAVVAACAAMGGIVGFLRYNTYPAKVFMGDSGSQFLGFTLGFLAILLTQRINTALSPALPALLLGLPVIDILAVFYLRAKGGMNLFRATRNHIHHRLLDRGFSHQASVVLIYSTQAFFVLSALVLMYEADWIILGLYLGVCSLVFILLTRAEHSGWRVADTAVMPGAPGSWQAALLARIGRWQFSFIQIWIPLSLVCLSLVIPDIPRDFAVISAVLAIAMALDLIFGNEGRSVVRQGSVFVSAMFVVYLYTLHFPPEAEGYKVAEIGIYAVLGISIIITLKLAKGIEFQTTSADYLTLFIVLLVGFFKDIQFLGVNMAEVVVKSVIVLYGCELISNRSAGRWTWLNLASLGSLGVLALRGLA